MTLPTGIRVAWRQVPAGSARRDVSRALLAELVAGARFRSRCPACGADHGRIHVDGADAAVSVSYVEGWAVAVAAWGHERVGVDAVPVDAGGLERVLPDDAGERAVMSAPSSTAPARAWARVEAVLKADGRGLAVDPRRVEVTPVTSGWSARVRSSPFGESPTRGGSAANARERRWRGWDVDGPNGVVIAVAVVARAETAPV